MDWQKIWLLVDIIHKIKDVPNTDYIWGCAMKELAEINTPPRPVPEPAEPELDLKARRL